MKRKVQLVLRSADIFNAGYNNASPYGPIEPTQDNYTTTGYINRWNSSMTWYNINIRSILGDLYKHDGVYMLKLESITFGLTSVLTVYTNVENNRAFNIIMSGLPFMSSYSSNYSKNEALIASVRVPNGSQAYIFNYSNNETSFKLQELNGINSVNIHLEFRDLLLNTTEPTPFNDTYAYPHSQYVFSIYLVE